MSRARAGIALATVAMSLGCGDPPAPTFAPGAAAEPAAASCVPPFERFGPGSVAVTDLDRGTSCVTELERDACIVAIFDDCTETREGVRREWQGRITGDRVDLRAFSVGRGAPDPRMPVACTATVTGPAFVAACTLADPEAEPHAGIAVELTD